MRPVRPSSNGTLIDTVLERQPLLVPGIAFVTGIALASSSQFKFAEEVSIEWVATVIIVATLLGVGAMLRPSRWVNGAFAFLIIASWAIAGLVYGHFHFTPFSQLNPELLNKPWKLEGVIIRAPKALKKDRAYAWIELTSLGNDTVRIHPNTRMILFYKLDQMPILRERDTLIWDGRIQALEFRSELKAYFQWLARNRVTLKGDVIYVDRIGRPADWQSHFQDLQQTLRYFLAHAIVDPAERSLSEALLLGVRSDLTPDLKQAFVYSGLAHLLALSGAHVGILLWLLWLVRRTLVWHPLGRALSTLVLIAVLACFPVLTGLSPSVVRACGMALIYLIGRLIYRDQPLLQVLGLMALIQLLIQPELIQNIGFQLSYAAVLGIGLVLPPVQARLKPYIFQIGDAKKSDWLCRQIRAAVKGFFDILTLSIAAQLFTAPLVLIHFGTFPLFFLVANVLAWPLSFAALTSGFVLMLLRSFEWITDILIPVHQLSLQALIYIAESISSLPSAQFGPVELSTNLLLGVWGMLVVAGLAVQVWDTKFSLIRNKAQI